MNLKGLSGKLMVSAAMFLSVSNYGLSEDSTPAPSENTPRTLSRVFSGTSVKIWYGAANTFQPLSGLSSVVDDDAATGWIPPKGKSVILIELGQLSEPDTLTFFAPDAVGSYTISAINSPEDAFDPTKQTKLLESSLSDNSVHSLNKQGVKYLVLDVNVIKPAPIRSIDLVGRPLETPTRKVAVVAPAASTQNSNKDQGETAEVNFASMDLGAKVEASKDSGMDTLIDGNTGTGNSLKPGEDKSGKVKISLAATIEVDRVSLAVGNAKGTLKVLAGPEGEPDTRELDTITLDGSSSTVTLTAPGVSADQIVLIWTPDTPGDPLPINEIGVFAMARVDRLGLGQDVLSTNSTPLVFSPIPTIPRASDTTNTQTQAKPNSP